jgi:general secretion pathway protein D
MKKSTLSIFVALLVLVSSCAPRTQSPDSPAAPSPASEPAASPANATEIERKAFSARLSPNAQGSVFIKPAQDKEQDSPSPTLQQQDVRQPQGGKQAKARTGILGRDAPKSTQAPASLAKAQESGTLSFDKADIAEVAHQIFGDHLQLNYILDPTIKGTINLHLEGEFSREQLLQMVIRAFQEVNVDVTLKDGVYYIKPMNLPNRNLEVADPTTAAAKGSANPVIVVYRPRFIQAGQGLNLIKPFLTPGRAVFSDQATNTLIFVENPQNAKSSLELLKAIDINLLDEIGMEIVPLKSLSPVEAVKTMTTVMGQMGVFRGSNLKDNLVLLPLEHYRGVLIFAQDPAVMDIAKQWLTAIDVRGSEMGEQINVYYVENALARDITDVLGQIFGKEKKKSQNLKNKLVGEASKATSTTSSGIGGTGSLSSSSSALVAASTGAAPAEVIDTELTGPMTFITDDNNNSIVVRSNPRDYATIKKVIRKLDLAPKAVLIEVVVAEVRLTSNLQYGVEWFLRGKNMGQGSNRFTGVLSGSNSLGSFDPGSAVLGNMGNAALSGLTGFIGTDSIQGLISLLDKNTDVNILATPSVLALDNTLASITVGGREPTVTQQQQSTTTQSNLINSVQYEETGLVLRVVPHISASGTVRLEVEQKIKAVNDETLKNVNLNTPRFTEREIRTSLITEDGRSVVIGGLISAQKTRSVDGIPVLGQLPILGFFFAKNSKDIDKTELLVSITPHVIKPRNDPLQNELLQRIEALRRPARTP